MIIKMKKLDIVGLLSEKEAVLQALRSFGCFELSNISDFEKLQSTEDTTNRSDYEHLHQRLNALDNAIDLLQKLHTEFTDDLKTNKRLYKSISVDLPSSPHKKPLFFYRESVAADTLASASRRGTMIYESALEIAKAKERIQKINATVEQNNNEVLRLLPFKNVDARLDDFRDFKHLFALLGTVSSKNARKIKAHYQSLDGFSSESFYSDKKNDVVFVSGPIEQKTVVAKALASFGFVRCELGCSNTPAAAIQELHDQNHSLILEKLKIYADYLNNQTIVEDLKLYHDCVQLEIESMDAQKCILTTKKTFCIEGWVPAEEGNSLIQKIKAISPCIECELVDVDESELEEGKQPPTLTRSNPLVSPYEAVTNMYSPPSPYEKDPNPFVAIFFFVFFGIMIGDAIYGLALFVLTFILLRCFKMESGFKKLLMILCMGGVSAFLCGIAYNSWAATGLPYNPLINPVEQPFDFLLITLGFGYFQIVFGFVLKLIANIRARSLVAALADSGWKLLIMIGGAMNIPSILAMFQSQLLVIRLPSLPPVIGYIGLALIALGFVGMPFTGGRNKKRLSAKIISGFGSWYDLVGILSDILSYCRLFGLALSGAIIGTVANILAKDVLFNIPLVGYALGIVVAVFFHLFNLALGCLGAYVHNARLQFVEFFGKFYEGGGRTFRPLGHATKYTTIRRSK